MVHKELTKYISMRVLGFSMWENDATRFTSFSGFWMKKFEVWYFDNSYHAHIWIYIYTNPLFCRVPKVGHTTLLCVSSQSPESVQFFSSLGRALAHNNHRGSPQKSSTFQDSRCGFVRFMTKICKCIGMWDCPWVFSSCIGYIWSQYTYNLYMYT